jgi:phosphotransferase system, enzyme I, PtsP
MRAFLKACETKPLNVFFPMITTLDEFITAKNICLKEYKRFEKLNYPLPRKMQFGIMIEVPIVAFEIEQFIGYCDFLCVGGNDLLQFSYAADRDNPYTATRYDRLSPSNLRLLQSIISKTHSHNIPVCFCGEMASNPIEIAALIAIGYRSFSLSLTQISIIKLMLRKLKISFLERIVRPYLEDKIKPTESLREALSDYIHGHKTGSS